MNANIIHAIDTFAVFVGVIHGFINFIALEMGAKGKYIAHDSIRYRLGIYILLGLEFLVAADILETVFKPSLEQLSILGGIVIIRTGLNYFLNKELADLKEDIK